MDFGIYPPEVNSGRMYTGPGTGPMLAGASAWEELAFELHSAAASYRSVIEELAGWWSGRSSASMLTAAAPYVGWLSSTAAQAEETAAQARAAAAAYEVAFAATVPPPVIAANRSLLMALLATNFFGQNTPAIAVTEAQYAEMWAQDTAAMYGYAGASASATTLIPFTDPPQTTDPGSSAGQAAAVSQATGTSAGNAQSTVASVPHTFSVVPNALQSAAAGPPAAVDPPSPVTALGLLSALLTIFPIAQGDVAELTVVGPLTVLNPVAFPFIVTDLGTGLSTDDVVSGWAGQQFLPGIGSPYPTDFPAVITNPGPLAGVASTMSAGVGKANAIGALSVPAAWTVAAPEVRPVALTLPVAGICATAGEALEAGSGSGFGQMALAGMSGAAMGRTGADPDGGDAPAGMRAAAGALTTGKRAGPDGKGEASQDKPRTVVTGIAVRIRELAMLRDEGSLTEEEYTEEKARLLGH